MLPIRKTISVLIYQLRYFRGKYLNYFQKPNLIPHQLVQSKSLMWESVDDDPHFIVDLSLVVQSRGWHLLRLTGADEKVLSESIFYLDYDGEGFSERSSIDVSSIHDGVDVLVRLPEKLKQLRFDPVNHKCEFTFSHIGFRPATQFEVIFRFVKLYLQRQRASGQHPLSAVKQKVAELGGWKNLSPRKLLLYAKSFDLTRRGSRDYTVHDYQQWITDFEKPYLQSHYQLTGTNNFTCALLAPKNVCDTLKQFKCDQAYHLPSSVNTQKDLLPLLRRFKKEERGDSCDYIVLILAAVELSPYFLSAVNESLHKVGSKKPLLIYTDHDHISNVNVRSAPFFKPEWSPEFQKTSSYIGPVVVIHISLFEKLCEDLTCEFPATYLIDKVCHLLPAVSERRVIRIPEVLFHIPSSDCILRPKSGGIVSTCYPGYESSTQYGVLPVLPHAFPLVSIIIPTKNGLRLLKACIESIKKLSTYDNYEILIVDNGSDDKSTLRYMQNLSNEGIATVIRSPGEFNYSQLNNTAAAQSQGEVLVLLNNDIEVITADWLEQLVRYAVKPEIGCVGAKLLYPDGRIQHAGVILGIHGVGAHVQRLHDRDADGYCKRLKFPQEYTAITAACLAIRKEVFDQVGGLNQKDLKVGFNDVDLCLKVKEAGYNNIWTPLAELYHHESVSRGPETSPEKARRLAKEAAYIMQRWGSILQNDPAYNPNLTLTASNFELSSRYVTRPLGEGSLMVNPAKDPYYHCSNINRVNSIRSSTVPECAALARTPGLSVIILTLEKYELISPLIDSLLAAKVALLSKYKINLQIIIGDTGSTSDDMESLYQRASSDITVVRDLSYHFSKCNNHLFQRYVLYETVLFLNNDILFDDPVTSLLGMYRRLANQSEVGVVGAYMLYPTKKLQHGGVDVFKNGPQKGFCFHPGHNTAFSAPDFGSSKRYPAVTGACLMMTAELFEQCAFFDESYEAEAQDVDLCLKAARLGLATEVVYVGEIIHYENGTRRKGEYNQRDRARFIRKWRSFLGLEHYD